MSDKKKTTKLQAAAAGETDAKTKRGALAAVLGLFGLGGKTVAKMTKTVEKYSEKREKMEESDEEEEESDAGTGTGDGTSSTDDGSTGTAEEEEESEGGTAEEEEEEEEAKAVARASRACRAAADAAYSATAATFPPAVAQQLALRSPARILRVARHATGARGIDDVMTALDRMTGATASAARIRADADLEARTAALENEGRKARIEGIIAKAKADGRAGALTKDGRASLRAHGMKNGSKALASLVAALPVVARTTATGARTARGDGGEEIDRSGGDRDEDNIVAAMTAGMDPKAKAAWEKDYKERLAASNGGGRAPRGG